MIPLALRSGERVGGRGGTNSAPATAPHPPLRVDLSPQAGRGQR